MRNPFALLFFLALCPVQALAGDNVLVSLNSQDVFHDMLSASARKTLEDNGISVTVTNSDHNNDKQVETIQSAVEKKYSAIIITSPGDAEAAKIDKIVSSAGIPLVFMNAMPGLDRIESNASIVASNDLVAGRMQMRYLAKLIGKSGDIAIIVGEVTNPAAIGRTRGIKEVLANLPDVHVIAEASANWDRAKARALVSGWLKEGRTFKAIAANNDEMALGAIEALEAAGIKQGSVPVAGIDATAVALDAMQAGRMSFTVLQNARKQGQRSAENALAMIRGDKVQLYDWVPYELVLPSNMASYR